MSLENARTRNISSEMYIRGRVLHCVILRQEKGKFEPCSIRYQHANVTDRDRNDRYTISDSPFVTLFSSHLASRSLYRP